MGFVGWVPAFGRGTCTVMKETSARGMTWNSIRRAGNIGMVIGSERSDPMNFALYRSTSTLGVRAAGPDPTADDSCPGPPYRASQRRAAREDYACGSLIHVNSHACKLLSELKKVITLKPSIQIKF